MPAVVMVGEPGRPHPTFVIPKLLRWAAEKEAAVARTKYGVGFIFTPYLSLPGKVHEQHLWAEVVPCSWWTWLRTGGDPSAADVGWGPRRV